MAELVRRGAELALRAPEEWFEELDAASMSSESMRAVAEDPALAAAIRASNRANLAHWAASNIRDPGAPVAPNLGREPLAIARDLVRRGMNESALDAYRTGQNAAWLRWMAIAFSLTRDPDELQELLFVTARSVAAFIDATIEALTALVKEERDELTRGTHAERREVVGLIVEGAPLTTRKASQRLGYDLGQDHRAAVIWSEDVEPDPRVLETAAGALTLAASTARPLTVVASAATLWVWLPGASVVDLGRLSESVHRARAIRIAIGTLGHGLEGFRRSHLDALTAQRMVARVGATQRVVSFDEIRLVSLVTQDPEGADQLVQHTLGKLASAPPELRSSLLLFLREGGNVSAAAGRLRTHRNTLMRRLARAEELLPRPLAESRIEVAVALEVLRWRGDNSGS